MQQSGFLNSKNEFARQDQLEQIARTYAIYTSKKEAEPYDDELIQDYIARITENMHQADDGTFFIVKDKVYFYNVDPWHNPAHWSLEERQ